MRPIEDGSVEPYSLLRQYDGLSFPNPEITMRRRELITLLGGAAIRVAAQDTSGNLLQPPFLTLGADPTDQERAPTGNVPFVLVADGTR